MSAVDPVWREGIMNVHREAAGVLSIEIFRQTDIPHLLGLAIAGDRDAQRALGAINMALSKIASAPRNARPLCVACPRLLRKGRYSLGVVLPACDDPAHALAVAICNRCSTDRKQMTAKVAVALQNIWPGLREIDVHQRVGHA